MNIQEMHNTFRVFGQQMGLQLNRGILPESIDAYINNAITERVRAELFSGVHTVLQENAGVQASTMSTVNSLRTLYKTYRISNSFEISNLPSGDITTPIFINMGKDNLTNEYNEKNGYHILNLPTYNIAESKGKIIQPMMYLGFSVEYNDNSLGNPTSCRLIGADVLETTLRDYCNGASKDSPIAVLLNGDEGHDQLHLYINSKNTIVKYLNIKYVKTPNVVKYDIDINKCVNCDLPEYLHFDIVENAVMKFYKSLGVGLAQQNQNQKNQYVNQ